MSTVCEKGHTGAQDLIWSSMQDPLKPPLIHYLPSSEVEYPRTDWDLILIDNICKKNTSWLNPSRISPSPYFADFVIGMALMMLALHVDC